MFIGNFHKSVLVTYIGVIATIIGFDFALNNNMKLAMMCLVIAGIADLFDGKIARMCKRTETDKKFGVEIDSLADTIAFVVFPVLIGFSLGMNEWYHIVGYTLISITGITRLGFFNINATIDAPIKCYSGLPVTSTSIIIPLIWFLFNKLSCFNLIYIISIYVIALLFILNIKIPKFKGIAYPILAVIGVIGLILLFTLGA